MSTTTVMVPDSIQSGLARYSLGDKLRHLRHQRRLRLVEVAASSGLSPSLISKLESNKLFPTLPTLWRLADAFHVGLEYFFSDEAGPSVPALVRASERGMPAGTNGHGFSALDLLQKAENANFNVRMIEVAVGADIHGQHAGTEFLYVMEGQLEVALQHETYHLSSGDSLYFQSTAPHTYRNTGAQSCKAFLVSTNKPQEGL